MYLLPAKFQVLCEAMGGYAGMIGGTERKSLASLVRAMTVATDSTAIVRACTRLCSPRSGDAVRDQAVVWCAEWHWLHGMPLDATVLPWPASDRLRLRMLTTCLNAGHVPPMAAWHWLRGERDHGACTDGARVPSAERQRHRNWDAAWPDTWNEFAMAMRRGARRACAVPYCALAGTRMADTVHAVLPDWTGAMVCTFFRCAWSRSRRTGRETASRLEDDWWDMLRDVFPGSEPERHVSLPGGMHLDVFWPREHVALEVQGEPHWQSVGVFGGAAGLAKRQERDARKRTLCAELGIRLVEATRHTRIAEVRQKLQQMATRHRRTGEKR